MTSLAMDLPTPNVAYPRKDPKSLRVSGTCWSTMSANKEDWFAFRLLSLLIDSVISLRTIAGEGLVSSYQGPLIFSLYQYSLVKKRFQFSDALPKLIYSQLIKR